ncbi:MAG: hypothetical protein ICV53_14685 [Flavisolibacter sp.]|nr:hypothetical protein [Flavisolibacter sp.]
MKRLSLLLCLLMPAFVFAQFDDYIPDSIVTADCDGKQFMSVETLPSVKGGETALSDSLSAYLKRRNVVIKDGKATFVFLVTTKSQIFETRQLGGDFKVERVFREGLKTYANMWIPAVQNFRKVCAMVRLEVAFSGDKMSVKIGKYMP